MLLESGCYVSICNISTATVECLPTVVVEDLNKPRQDGQEKQRPEDDATTISNEYDNPLAKTYLYLYAKSKFTNQVIMNYGSRYDRLLEANE